MVRSYQSMWQLSKCFDDFYIYNLTQTIQILYMTEELLDFKLGATLGCGAFGKVRKAIHVPTGRKVAIKFLMKKKIRNEEDRLRVRRETEILKKIQHPNLIRLLQVVEND